MNTHDILVKQKVEFAILNHKLLKFDYVSNDISLTRDRIVEPIQMLKGKDGELDKVACNKWPYADFLDVEQRIFSFKGIENLRLIDYDKTY